MKPSISTSKIRKIIILVIWLTIWQGVYWYVGKEILIPSPLKTLSTLVSMLGNQSFYMNVVITIYRVCVGVVISVGLGLITAIGAYLSIWMREFLVPFMTLLKSTPVMAIIILALLWFHSGQVPIFACFLMCYPIVYTNVLTGLDHVDTQLIEMARVYQVKNKYIIRDIYFPHITSYIKSALSLTVGLAWKVVVAAEVLAVPKYSMGYNLLNAKVYLETAELFSWVIVIVLLSSAFEKGINVLIFRKGTLHL